MQTQSSTVAEHIRALAATDLIWRVSSPGAMGTGTRAEAMIRTARGPWIFGYGLTVKEALADVLAKWETHS